MQNAVKSTAPRQMSARRHVVDASTTIDTSSQLDGTNNGEVGIGSGEGAIPTGGEVTGVSGATELPVRDRVDVDRRGVLDVATTKLVWSRLQELSAAMIRVEIIRMRLERTVAESLDSARGLAKQTLPDREEVTYASSFSHFFRELIGYLSFSSPR